MTSLTFLAIFALLQAALRGDGAAEGKEKTMRLEFSKAEPTCDQVSAVPGSGSGAGQLSISIKPGSNGYPGCIVKPKTGNAWDLSAFGHMEAVVTNRGAGEVRVLLRVDNEGDWKKNPWNTEAVQVPAGGTRTVRVIFGYGDGMRPGFKLNPAKVPQLLFFTGKTDKAVSFEVVSVTAGGPPGEKPPADPDSVRVKPKNGVLTGKGALFRTQTDGGAQAEKTGEGLRVTFGGRGQSVMVLPEQGRWDLREYHQVRVKLKNTGARALSVTARVESGSGATDEGKPPGPLPPEAAGEVVISFIPATPWLGNADAHKAKEKIAGGKGTRFTSDAVRGVTIAADGGGECLIESITATAPPWVMPDWLGKRPPAEGDWTMTFQEEFDGSSVNLSKWNIYTANYWDKLSHFSKDNVTVKNGVAVLRYEKKTGRHNDDPKGAETPYASGFLDTYGKWVQRYGYFEARMKLPNAPGLWPAMWLMPDRGLAKGEQWRRASTQEGGMEYDIMEHLARWGRYRFNIAFHWDGYQDEHRQTGSTCIYTDHDQEGFITSGLLWLPGKAVIYCNGREAARWESPRVSSVPADVMFTHVMGGWDNDDLDDARLPAEFVIDYVRCWQRKDLASAVDGVKSTQATPAAPVK